MSNSEDSNITELVEALRSHVERGAHSTMSSESIAGVANILTELSAILREDLNSRIPLFQLSVEIQQQILEHVPDPLSKSYCSFRTTWHSGAMETSMLRPVLQTCRQLRRVALSHVFLWKTISPTQKISLPSILLRDIPLIAVIDGSWGDKPAVLGSLDKVDAHRVQELHLFDLVVPRPRDDITTKIHEYFKAGLPLLESLSICHVSTRDEEGDDDEDEDADEEEDEDDDEERGEKEEEDEDDDEEGDEEDEDEDNDEEGDEDTGTNECPFPLDDVPRLRHMMLGSVTFIPTNEFPHLTHLTLSDIDTPDCHIETARLLSRCPNLESLAISYPDIKSGPLDLPDDFPHSLTLNHLHRVTLLLPQHHAHIMDLYLSFFPENDSIPQPTALQILALNIRDDASALSDMLPRITKAEASHLSLVLLPFMDSTYSYLSIAAAGPKGTFHVSTESFPGTPVGVRSRRQPGVSPKTFLNSVLPSCAHLSAVREVWVSAIAMPTPPPFFRDAMEHFRSTITGLPALETVVLLVTAVGDHGQLEVDLGLCPSAHDPGFASPDLKTLRIVHGSEKLTGSGPVEKVRLTSLLDQVRTGAYGYFENVVLETMPRLVVDGEDLARLRACFKNVTFQHVSSMPTMPLPDYCTEPYAGPDGTSTWDDSLW